MCTQIFFIKPASKNVHRNILDQIVDICHNILVQMNRSRFGSNRFIKTSYIKVLEL